MQYAPDLLGRDRYLDVGTSEGVGAGVADDVADKDSELVALEVECRRAGQPVVFVDLPVEGLDERR